VGRHGSNVWRTRRHRRNSWIAVPLLPLDGHTPALGSTVLHDAVLPTCADDTATRTFSYYLLVGARAGWFCRFVGRRRLYPPAHSFRPMPSPTFSHLLILLMYMHAWGVPSPTYKTPSITKTWHHSERSCLPFCAPPPCLLRPAPRWQCLCNLLPSSMFHITYRYSHCHFTRGCVLPYVPPNHS